MSLQIATAVEEQSAVGEDIQRNLDGIRETGQSTVAASGRSRHSAEHVASLVGACNCSPSSFAAMRNGAEAGVAAPTAIYTDSKREGAGKPHLGTRASHGLRHAHPAQPAVCHRPAGVGTHIVRTGILRVYGSQLRASSANTAAGLPPAGVRRRHRRHRPGAEQQRHRPAGHLLRRPGLMALPPALAIMLGADVGTALMAPGADPRPGLAVAAADLRWCCCSSRANEPRRADWPRGHRPRPAPAGPATDRRGGAADRRIQQHRALFASLTGDPAAGRPGRRAVRHPHLFQPGRRAAHRDAGRQRHDQPAGGHRPGHRRQCRQACWPC